jgi:hypothetical protein
MATNKNSKSHDSLFETENLPKKSDAHQSDWLKRNKERNAKHSEELRIARENRISEQELAFWGDEDRAGIPPELARGAIFRLPRRGRRRYFYEEILIRRPSLSIGFTGKELDQFDGEVYLAIIRALQGQHIGERVEISLKGLAHELRRVKSGGTVKNITESLKRLSSCTLHLQFKRRGKNYKANIHLMSWVYEEEARKTYVRLYADAEQLFQQLAWIDFKRHLALPSNLAKMVHMYVTSHTRGKRRSTTLDEFIDISGSQTRRNDFRTRLLEALNALEDAGVIDEVEITARDVVKWRLLPYDTD